MNSESELKYSLTAKEFKTLKKHLSPFPHDSKKQINYYFDSVNLALKKKKIGLRIRITEKKTPMLTIKFPKSHKTKNLAALKVRYEYEEPISNKDAQRVLKGGKGICDLKTKPIRILKYKVAQKSLDQLVKLGALKNHRTTYKFAHGLILELDQFTYFGKSFYELEIETSKPNQTDLKMRELFKNLKIKYRPEKKSKLARFLKEWKIKKA